MQESRRKLYHYHGSVKSLKWLFFSRTVVGLKKSAFIIILLLGFWAGAAFLGAQGSWIL